ncbi:hypothetical protein E4U54_000128 [Claviceps lovelessii]|nr:hypothetical protein E4U54_000128 [Claviceps lovelessii]
MPGVAALFVVDVSLLGFVSDERKPLAASSASSAILKSGRPVNDDLKTFEQRVLERLQDNAWPYSQVSVGVAVRDCGYWADIVEGYGVFGIVMQEVFIHGHRARQRLGRQRR